MKNIIIFIIICLLGNLNLFADLLPPGEQASFNMMSGKLDNWQGVNPNLTLQDAGKLSTDVAPCTHCAAPYALLLEVRKILKTLPGADKMPELGELELQTAIAQFKSFYVNSCTSVYETLDRQAHKRNLDGKFEQIAEGAFEKYSSIALIAYHPPDIKQTFYYYRDSNNHIVEVIVDSKGKAKFRLYNFTPKPDAKIKNVEDTLPVIAGSEPEMIKLPDPYKKTAPAPTQTFTAPVVGINGHYSSSLHADLIPRDGILKFLPKDLTLYDGSGDVSYGVKKVSGKISSTLAQGHKVEISVVNGTDDNQDALIHYSASTTANGQFKEATVRIPLNLSIGTAVGVTGEVSDARSLTAGSKEQRMVMAFFEPAVDGIRPRSEYVTVSVTQHEGQPVVYDLKKSFDTDASIISASAGKSATGAFVGVGYSPRKNQNQESLQIKFVDESGKVAGYATYFRVF